MNRIIIIILILTPFSILAQDSVRIYFYPLEVEDWPTNHIVFSQKHMLFNVSIGGTKYSSLKINRYVEFWDYLKSECKEANVKSIDSFVLQNQESIKEIPRYLISFYFFYGETAKVYMIPYYENYDNLEYQSPFLDTITDFFHNFFVEHKCQNFYQIHETTKGETFENIAKLYGVNTFTLLMYYEVYFEEFEKINRKDIDIGGIYDGEQDLKEGDKILVPCYPQKVSKYE